MKDWHTVICGWSPSSNFKSRSQFVETANDTVRRPSRERRERERRRARPPSHMTQSENLILKISPPSCNQAPRRVVTAIAIRPTPYVLQLCLVMSHLVGRNHALKQGREGGKHATLPPSRTNAPRAATARAAVPQINCDTRTEDGVLTEQHCPSEDLAAAAALRMSFAILTCVVT